MVRLAYCLAISLIGSFALVSAAGAEPEPAEMLTSVNAERAASLVRDIGYRAEVISPVSETTHRIRTRIGGRDTYVLLYGCKQDKCNSMQVRTSYAKTDGYDLAIANDWNYSQRFVKVYLDPDESINAEMDIMVAGGMTINTLQEYLNVFEDQLREIHAHFQKSRKTATPQTSASSQTEVRRWR